MQRALRNGKSYFYFGAFRLVIRLFAVGQSVYRFYDMRRIVCGAVQRGIACFVIYVARNHELPRAARDNRAARVVRSRNRRKIRFDFVRRQYRAVIQDDFRGLTEGRGESTRRDLVRQRKAAEVIAFTFQGYRITSHGYRRGYSNGIIDALDQRGYFFVDSFGQNGRAYRGSIYELCFVERERDVFRTDAFSDDIQSVDHEIIVFEFIVRA